MLQYNLIRILFRMEVLILYAKYDALDVAEYVLWYCDEELKRPISNLRLQKILYYIQGKYLYKFHKPLFDNDIEAWAYGPVVPDVYYEYRKYGSEFISGVKPLNEDILSEIDKKLIIKVVKENYKEDVWKLVDKTHTESPWKHNYKEGYKNIISITDMEEEFA